MLDCFSKLASVRVGEAEVHPWTYSHAEQAYVAAMEGRVVKEGLDVAEVALHVMPADLNVVRVVVHVAEALLQIVVIGARVVKPDLKLM